MRKNMDTTTEAMTYSQLIEQTGVTMIATSVDSRPDGNLTMEKNMDHWCIELKSARGSFVLFYSMGLGHRKPLRIGRLTGALVPTAPKLAEVLDSVASDSVAATEMFADWCDSYGYDVDSRKALVTYEQCQNVAIGVHKVLGASLFYSLMNDVERL